MSYKQMYGMPVASNLYFSSVLPFSSKFDCLPISLIAVYLVQHFIVEVSCLCA